MLWIAIVAALLLFGVGVRRSASPGARFGFIAGLVALTCLVLATRFGLRTLVVIAPALAWLASGWLRAKAVGERPPQASTVPRSRGQMTREDALRVLGLRENATKEAIVTAHRNLIKKVHPDHGGSDLLAQQVNEAKKVLEATAP
ncbi:MAG: hypothetical protein EOO73_11825 [Myxococcales bacterium]|nr:MAG: hypothetical protein EOO73_11825 [Myxococcales bacterium]